MIAAVSENGVIGLGNRLPWRLPDDLKEFKRITMGHHLVMGRRTWEGVGSLPGRTTIVLSRSARDLPEGTLGASSVEEAIEMAADAGETELFVAGGGEIYRQALERVDRIYLTRVQAEVEGDTLFPDLGSEWREVSRQDRQADDRHQHAFSLLVLERDGAPAEAASP